MGEGAGAGQPVVSGYIADKTGVERRATVFSTLAITNALAATGGALLAGLPKYFEAQMGLDMIAAHQLLFWIGALGGVVSLLMVIPIGEVKPVRQAEMERARLGLSKKSWGVIAKFSIVRSTSGLGWGFIESLMSLYFYIRFGAGGDVVGPIYAAARFMSVFSYLLVPIVVDRFGDIDTIVASRIISAALAVAFSLSSWFPLAVVFMVAMRIAIMFTMPIRQSLATEIVDPDETATVIGVSNFARMSLRTVAPTVAAYMFEAISLSAPFIAGSALLALNGILFKIFFGPKEP